MTIQERTRKIRELVANVMNWNNAAILKTAEDGRFEELRQMHDDDIEELYREEIG